MLLSKDLISRSGLVNYDVVKVTGRCITGRRVRKAAAEGVITAIYFFSFTASPNANVPQIKCGRDRSERSCIYEDVRAGQEHGGIGGAPVTL
ncbi:MAG: hypothetical protein ACLP3B_27170, partial [Syntrophobacteraceae bacterium]